MWAFALEPAMHIHVIHENAAWLEPLARALDAERLPWRQWFLDRGVFDLSATPLERAGIATPKTVLVAGEDDLAMAARQHFGLGPEGAPVILKPNRGGKGLG